MNHSDGPDEQCQHSRVDYNVGTRQNRWIGRMEYNYQEMLATCLECGERVKSDDYQRVEAL